MAEHLATCRDCAATYSGRMQHCVLCHETFGGDEAATRHQGPYDPTPGTPSTCRPPGSIMHKNGRPILSKNASGVWVRAFGC